MKPELQPYRGKPMLFVDGQPNRVARTIGAALVFFLVGATSGHTSQLVDNLSAGKDQTVVVFGTSLTERGAWPAQMETWLNSQGYQGKATVINKGKSGSDTKSHGVPDVARDVVEQKADTVFVEFGMNDCIQRVPDRPPQVPLNEFKANLTTIVERIRAGLPAAEIILLTMNPARDSARYPNSGKFRAALPDYYQAVRDLGRVKSLLVVDTFPAWNKLEPATLMKFIPDGVHPVPAGNETVTTPAIQTALRGVR